MPNEETEVPRSLYTIGYDDARNGEEPFSDLNWIYMQGYNAGLMSKIYD